MAYNNFSFDPEAGFADTSFYEDTPQNPREILQRQHNQTRDFINSLVNTLNSDVEGSSGSESIMSPEIEGVAGTNVFEQIKDIKRQINDAAEGIIPDSSVTEEKLSVGAVGEEKIKIGSVTTEKFNENAIAPFANEVLNINGHQSSGYTPLNKTGFSGVFKELVCGEKLGNVYGKIYNKKRYLIKDEFIYTLNLTTGELIKLSDKKAPSSPKIAVVDEDNIYLVTIIRNKEDNYAYAIIYKYEREYDEIRLLNEIKLFNTSSASHRFIDIDVTETHLLMGIGSIQSSSNYNYIYKIPLSEIESLESLERYYSFSVSKVAKSFFIHNGDLFFGDRIFKGTNTEEIISLPAEAKSCDSFGNLLIEDSSLPIWDLNTSLPKCADIYSMSGTFESFVYENHYYILVGGYLFKARLS